MTSLAYVKKTRIPPFFKSKKHAEMPSELQGKLGKIVKTKGRTIKI